MFRLHSRPTGAKNVGRFGNKFVLRLRQSVELRSIQRQGQQQQHAGKLRAPECAKHGTLHLKSRTAKAPVRSATVSFYRYCRVSPMLKYVIRKLGKIGKKSQKI